MRFNIEIVCPYCEKIHMHVLEVEPFGESGPEEIRVDNEPAELPNDSGD